METKEPDKFTAVDRSKKYTDEDLKPYVQTATDWAVGKPIFLPNIEPISTKDALNTVANGFGQIKKVYIRHQEGEWGCAWGILVLRTLQSGHWDGTGIAIVPMYGANQDPWCVEFALCEHETKYMPTARPQRGLHDKFCVKCGLDMSVDSSD